MNQKGFGTSRFVLLLLILSLIPFVGWKVYVQSPGSKNKEAKVGEINEEGSKETECESKPIAGTVIFDIAQSAPFVDPRVNEIKKDINASRVTWRDGSIIKIDGKDYSSGKYLASVQAGSEASAVDILKHNSQVTYAAQDSTFCPSETKLIVE